ncbi:MAG: 1-phosphofructokinase family hexose kinase [Thermoleophilia bacterium]
MIVTVTLNAALDRTLSVPNFQAGTRNRASDALTLPGGKGVNVARALKRLGEPVIATGLAGGRTGTSIIEGLTEEGILNDFVRIRGESRTSTAVVDPNGRQTEIIEYGPEVGEDELAVLLEKIRYLARGADMFVLSGSLPRNVPDDYYAAIIRELKGQVYVALDAQGPPLRAAVGADPDLVSPNARETEEIVGYEFSEDDDLVAAAETLTSMGAQSAIVHQADGCVARIREPGEKSPVTYRVLGPVREALSTVGSGDAFLAGYLTGVTRAEDVRSRLTLAVACGIANIQSPGAGIFDRAEVDANRRQVQVWEVEAARAGPPT